MDGIKRCNILFKYWKHKKKGSLNSSNSRRMRRRRTVSWSQPDKPKFHQVFATGFVSRSWAVSSNPSCSTSHTLMKNENKNDQCHHHSVTDNEFFVIFEKAYSMLRDRFGTSHDFQKYTSICWFGCLSQHLVVHWWINVTCSFFFCLPDLKMQLFHPTYLIKKKCHHQIKNKWFSSLSYI